MLTARILAASFVLGLALLTVPATADPNWPGWRGPSGDGHSLESGFPQKWSNADVVWKTTLTGEGQSSPVIWGERIFLTTAVENGAKRVVICLNRKNGKLLWEKTAWTGSPERTHNWNGWASPSCATDGEHVYAFFGSGGGLFCYGMDGDLLWNVKFGQIDNRWGTAASPLIYGRLVIQNSDADSGGFIAAYDKSNGKPVWKTQRDTNRGWSSPILVDTKDRKEIVVNGHKGVRAYDPKTGKELWFCKSFNGRGSPTVTRSATGLLHVVNGLRGDTYAIKPGGSGNVTGTHMIWHSSRGGGRDLPSPIAVGKFLLIMNKDGILTCYDTASGVLHWRTRIGGKFSGSPISYDGLAVFMNERGETIVVQPGPVAKIVARNKIEVRDDEIFRSSLTVSDGQIFIRGSKTLYCVGKRKSAGR